MKRSPKAGLDKHVETKHHAVSATNGRGQDHRDPLVPMGQKSADNENNGQDCVSKDVACYVGGSKYHSEDNESGDRKKRNLQYTRLLPVP